MSLIQKLPLAKDNFFVDFTAQLGALETISNPTASAFDQTLNQDATSIFIGTPSPVVSGNKAIFWYQGGSPGHTYVVSVTVQTSLNRILEGTVVFEVVPNI